jgi:enoyl-CoA hydratase/carnithine racemase
VLKGEGRAFCAGGDIVSIYESGLQQTNDSRDFFFEEYILNYIIGTLKTPHVAILNGITSMLLSSSIFQILSGFVFTL